MNAARPKCSLWACSFLLAYIGSSSSIPGQQGCDLQVPGQPVLDDELQLLQVQSTVHDRKQRIADLSPDASLTGAESKSSPSTKHAVGLPELRTAVQNATGEAIALADRSNASGKWALAMLFAEAKSGMASQLVFGFNGRYCERRFGGLLNHHATDGNHGAEITNSVTAAFIFFVGIYQLAAWNHQSAFIRLLCGIVVLNGWSSGLRHFADIPYCAVLDGMTMVVGGVLACCFIVDLYTQRSKDVLVNAILRVLVWAGMPALCCFCFCSSPNSFDAHTQSLIFGVLFALPLICICVGVYGSLWLDWVRWTSVEPTAIEMIKFQLKVGVPLALLGAACLGISELLCDESMVAQYFPGHALWHVLFPFGVNALLLYVCALWADTKNQPMTFHKSTSKFKTKMLGIAPAFTSYAPARPAR